MRKPQIAPYRICIHTTDYTGNFKRELVGYALGVLDEWTEDNLSWNDPDDYCKHWFYQDIMKMPERLYYLKLSEKFKEQTGFDDLLNPRTGILIKNYLLETMVDDHKNLSFYYISKYFKDKEWDYNSLYIQLDKPLSKIWEEIIITRIFKFFNDTRIRNEDRGCLQFFKEWDKRKCISIELIDDKDNIIKAYLPEDYDFDYPLKNYFELTSKFN